MKSLKALFAPQVMRLHVGDRVQNNNSKELGEVIGTAVIGGSVKVLAVSVQYDSGLVSNQVAENEFTKIGK